MQIRRLIFIGLASCFLAGPVQAQDHCVEYRYVPTTEMVRKPVTRYRWVDETEHHRRQVTESVPVYSTEKRERVKVTFKPVTQTGYRDETYEVKKPVTETRYRERSYKVTEYETTTELRDQTVVVEKPVTETRYREERVLVRKPVRKTRYETENVTSLRPVRGVETEYTPATVLVQPPRADRTRLEWLRRGYYWDANLGKYVYRRPGLHWTDSPGQPTATQGWIAQPRETTAWVPRTEARLKPVDYIDYEERVELRKVPVKVETTQRIHETRQVPVEVRKPVTRTKTERVPYEETRYITETRTRKVPVRETTMQRVEEVQPYEKTTARWIEKTRDVEVPVQVRKRVPYQTTELVPQTVWHKVPVDAFGNAVGPPVRVSPPVESASKRERVQSRWNDVSESTTWYDRPASDDSGSSKSSGASVLERESLQETSARQVIDYHEPTPVRSGASSSSPDDSIVFPETTPDPANSRGLTQVDDRPKRLALDETSENTTSDHAEDSTSSAVADPSQSGPHRVEGTFIVDPVESTGTNDGASDVPVDALNK